MLTYLENDLLISPIQREDISRIGELLKSNGMNYSSVELYWEHFVKVEMDNALIGCIAIIPRKGFSEIKSLLVIEEYRSFKVFNKLCDAITYKAREQKNLRVVLKVDKHNPATILYRRKGFVSMDKEKYKDIYKQLRSDCIACHAIVKSICNPTYFVYDIAETIPKHSAFNDFNPIIKKEVDSDIEQQMY
jgi:N-acetylglutamate synthase-like GNAT family acetyltransferase